MILTSWIILIVVVGICGYHRAKPLVWFGVLFALLTINSYFHLLDRVSLIICWVLLLVLTAVTFSTAIRRLILSGPLMLWFKKQMPPISEAEQVVLDAGGSWWETEVFANEINWHAIHAHEITPLTQAEQEFIDQQVTTFCNMLNEWKINNQDKDLPKAAWDYIKKERFWALCMDPKYGGLGFSHVAHSAIVTKIASASISAAYTVMVPNSLGPAELIDYCGTAEQKQHYLPKLARGEEIGCFGLTSLYAGSDAASIPDRGIVCKGLHEGKEVLGIRLNFEKRYITLAPVATLIGCAFRLFDPDQLIGEKEDIGITVALVSSTCSGVNIGQRHSPLTLGFMNGPISGKDVFIPIDWVIGGVEQCGKGWKTLVGCLSIGRGISMPALSAAVAQQCYSLSGAYSYVRRQFKRKISDFEGIQEALGHVGGMSYLIEANRYVTTQAVVDGARPSVAAAMVKYHLTQCARRVLEVSMDLHSGHALQAGPSNILAEVYAGLPISTVGEGANLLTRNLIIFGQGVLRSHPYLRDEIMAAVNQDNLLRFDQVLRQHLGYSFGVWTRAKVAGWTKGRLLAAPKGPLQYYYKQVQRYSYALTAVSDVALAVLGKDLKLKEFISARLGDIFSHLYMAISVLKYAHDHRQGKQDLPYAKWALAYCLNQCAQSFEKILTNFPSRTWSYLLRIALFPWGIKSKYPKDDLHRAIARDMQKNGALRERLTHLCHIGSNPNDPIGRVTRAWRQLLSLEPISRKVSAAIQAKKIRHQLTLRETYELAAKQGIISDSEFEALLAAEQLRDGAIMVDEFAFEALARSVAEKYKPSKID